MRHTSDAENMHLLSCLLTSFGGCDSALPSSSKTWYYVVHLGQSKQLQLAQAVRTSISEWLCNEASLLAFLVFSRSRAFASPESLCRQIRICRVRTYKVSWKDHAQR
jgi:hypothetical protein